MPEKKQKIHARVVVLSVIALVVVLVLIFGAYNWFLQRQKRVLDGFARPNFPFSDYSVEELGAMYPQYVNVDVVTTRTPEETHRMFVDKLKAGDLNGAVECCFRQGDWNEMKAGLERVKAKGELNTMIKDLDTEIKVDFQGDTLSNYTYSNTVRGQQVGGDISFIKNNQGVWLIKSL